MSRGLRSAWLLNGQGNSGALGYVLDSVRKVYGVPSGATWSPRGGINFNAGQYVGVSNWGPEVSGNIGTLFIEFLETGAPDTYGAVMFGSNTGASCYFQIHDQLDSAGRIAFLFSSDIGVGNNLANFWNNSSRQTIGWVSMDGTAAGRAVYYNGVPIHTPDANAPVAWGSGDKALRIGNWAGGISWDFAGVMGIVYYWDRGLSEFEMKSLERDPYQMFAESAVAPWFGGLTAAGALLKSAVSAVATQVSAFTTAITAAANVAASVAAAAALTTSIVLGGAVSATATQTSDLTTEITLASAPSASVTQASNLTTEITLAASATSAITQTSNLTAGVDLFAAAVDIAVTQASALTTEITLSTALSVDITQVSDLTVGVDLFASSVNAIVTQASSLTTEITAAAAISSAVTVAADLTISGVDLLAASVSASVSQVSNLTTEILLSSSVDVAATQVSTLTTDITLASSVSSSVSQVSSLTTEITAAASVLASVTQASNLTIQPDLFVASVDATVVQASNLTTEITLASSSAGAITAVADLTAPSQVLFQAASVATVIQSSELTTGVTLASSVVGSITQVSDLTVPVDLFASAVNLSVSQVSDLTTSIAFKGDISGTVVASADLAALEFATVSPIVVTSSGALTTEIWLAAEARGRVRADPYTTTWAYLRGVLQLAPLDIDPLANGIMSLSDLIHMTDIWGGWGGLVRIPDVIPHLVTMNLTKSLTNVKLTGKDITMRLTKSEFDIPA